jgi:hypothetical protein
MSSEAHTSGIGTTTTTSEPDQRFGSFFSTSEPESQFGSTTSPTGQTSDLPDSADVSAEDQDQSAEAQHQFQSRN